MKFMGNHSNYQGREIYKKEVNINEIFVSSYVAGYGFPSDILTLAKSILKLLTLFKIT